MKTKETFATKMIKRFYGVQGVLDEYRRQELYKIGNTGFMAMFCYMLLSNCIVLLILSLDNYKHSEDLITWYIMANLLFVVFGTSGYIIITTKRRHLIENEVAAKDIQSQKKRLVDISIRQGVCFGTLTFIFNGITSPGFSDLTSWHTMIVYIIEGVFFGIVMYFFQKMNLKTVK